MIWVETHFPLKSSAAYFYQAIIKFIPDSFISCTTEKREVSSAKSLGFELKLSDKSLI